MTKSFIIYIFILILGCDDNENLVNTELNIPASTLNYMKYSNRLSKVCNTSQESTDYNIDYTCEYYSNNALKTLITHNRSNCLSGEENDCIQTYSYFNWFDDFYEVCFKMWSSTSDSNWSELICSITTYDHIEMVEEAESWRNNEQQYR